MSSPPNHHSEFCNPTTFRRRDSGIAVILEAIEASEPTFRTKDDAQEIDGMTETASDTSIDHVQSSNRCSDSDPTVGPSSDHNSERGRDANTVDSVMTDAGATGVGPPTIPADKLSWRQSPSESFSDWTIEVIQSSAFDETKSVTPYHVHRRALAVGPKRSDYFAQLFKESSSTNTSQLHLSKAQASVFPMVLDHMYTQAPLVLDSATAYSLYSLAEQLGIPSVLQAATDFYRQRMNAGNVIDFIKLGQTFREKSLFDAAVSTCAGEMKLMGFQTCAKLDPEIMYLVMIRHQALPRSMKCGSGLLSQLVAICVSNATRATLSHETFKMLTDEEFLPCVESTAAIKLLATENSLLNGNQGSPEFEAESLRTRCVTSIIQDWEALRSELEHNFELSNTMKSISSRILFDVLMKTKMSSNVSDSSSVSACDSDERVTAV
jgi:hypothetical protein